MKPAELFGMDDHTFDELRHIGEKIVQPDTSFSFGHDFADRTAVVLANTRVLAGETAVQAHIRLQSERQQ